MKIRTTQSQITFENPIQEVFRFFCRPENLNETTPDFLQFHIMSSQPIKMHENAIINYRLKLFGIPFKWQTLIHEWQPPFYFTDKQLRGPYLLWEHEHFFEEKNGQVTMTDTIRFAIPGLFFESIIYHLFVKNWVNEIMNYRKEKAVDIFNKRKLELL